MQRIRIERVLQLPRETLRLPGTIYLVQDDNEELLQMHVVGNARNVVRRIPTRADIVEIVQQIVDALDLQDGASAYDIAVSKGFVGTETNWLQSLKESAYEHVESSPSAEWVVNHNRGQSPIVEVIDSAGRQIEADVLHINVNQTRIYFNQPVAGKAIAR